MPPLDGLAPLLQVVGTMKTIIVVIVMVAVLSVVWFASDAPEQEEYSRFKKVSVKLKTGEVFEYCGQLSDSYVDMGYWDTLLVIKKVRRKFTNDVVVSATVEYLDTCPVKESVDG